MPVPVLNAYIVQEPALRAQERLGHIEDLMLGGGLVPKDRRSQRLRELERTTRPAGTARPKLSKQQAEIMIVAAGIGIRRIPAKAATNG